MNHSPLIFIHYGASSYLYYTLRCARKFNPLKRIILVGDVYNRMIASICGVEFRYMKDFANSPEEILFNKSYKFISGEKHGRPLWTNFVFRRWFILHNFLRVNGIQSFWTFDSDTMILCNLTDKEKYFSSIDNTEQCGGLCLNGFIKKFEVVDGYISSMLDTFNNQKILSEISNEMLLHPEYAFTEMKAYEIYKQNSSYKALHLVNFLNNETFDDCICFCDGMELSEHKAGEYSPKKIFSDGIAIYFKNAASGCFIKANTINMSWVPDSYFEKIYEEAKNNLSNWNKAPGHYKGIIMHTFSFQYSLDNIFFNLLKFINKIKRFFRSDEAIR